MIPGKGDRLAGCADDRYECLVFRRINHRRGDATEAAFMGEHLITDAHILDRCPAVISQHPAFR